MARQSNEERIAALLRRRPGLDDDEISQLTGIEPRQQVNQICRRLERRGVLTRTAGPRGKIVNALVGALSRNAPSTTLRHVRRSDVGAKTAPPADDETWHLPARDDLTDTLLIVPCSKSKEECVGRQTAGSRIGNRLPASLAERLDRARAANRRRAAVDERTLAPAWQRYSGRFYQAAGDALAEAVRRRLHLLILSGGYGVLLAREPIGLYEAALRTSWWPEHVLERVLAGYTRRHRLKCMRAFVSRTTAYRQVVERTDWKAAGVDDAVLLMPVGGPQDSVSRAQGDAFAALLSGTTLDQNWRSKAGLPLTCRRLV